MLNSQLRLYHIGVWIEGKASQVIDHVLLVDLKLDVCHTVWLFLASLVASGSLYSRGSHVIITLLLYFLLPYCVLVIRLILIVVLWLCLV